MPISIGALTRYQTKTSCIDSNEWEIKEEGGIPGDRRDHAMCIIRKSVVVLIGGYSRFYGSCNDVFLLETGKFLGNFQNNSSAGISAKILSDLLTMFNKSNLSDFKIIFTKENKTLYTHKHIIYARSRDLENFFCIENSDSFIVNDHHYDSYYIIIYYLYSGFVDKVYH